MTYRLTRESDNLAACYLFILERMRARKQQQETAQTVNATATQAGKRVTSVDTDQGINNHQDRAW